MTCFSVCFGFPKRVSVFDEGAVQMNPLVVVGNLSSSAQNCRALSSGCERRAVAAWIATASPQRIQDKAPVDAVDAFDPVSSTCVQLRSSNSSPALSVADRTGIPASYPAAASAVRVSISPSNSNSRNLLRPVEALSERLQQQPLRRMLRPFASISAPLLDETEDSEGDNSGEAWIPAPKPAQAAVAPLLLVDHEGWHNSNMELGDFCESMLLSMQIRFKVDAELSTFRQISPSACSNRFVARLSIGQSAAQPSTALSTPNTTPCSGIVSGVYPGGGGGGGGCVLPSAVISALQRTERPFVSSLDWTAGSIEHQTSPSPSQRVQATTPSAPPSSEDPLLAGYRNPHAVPATAAAVAALRYPVIGRGNSNFVGRSSTSSRRRLRIAIPSPLQAAELIRGSGSVAGSTLPSGAEGHPACSTAAKHQPTYYLASEAITNDTQLVSDDTLGVGNGHVGANMWHDSDMAAVALEPAIDIPMGSMKLPTHEGAMEVKAAAYPHCALLEPRLPGVKALGSMGGSRGSGSAEAGPTGTGFKWGEALADGFMLRVSGEGCPVSAGALAQWLSPGMGQSPPQVPPGPSLLSNNGGGSGAAGDANAICVQCGSESIGHPPFGSWESQPQGGQPPSYHHQYHALHSHGRQPYSGAAGGSQGRVLRPIPEVETMSINRLPLPGDGTQSVCPVPVAVNAVPTDTAADAGTVGDTGEVVAARHSEVAQALPSRSKQQVSPFLHDRSDHLHPRPSRAPGAASRGRKQQSGSDSNLVLAPRSASWYGGAPAVHPDPTRVSTDVPVELRLCHSVSDLFEGMSDVRALPADESTDATAVAADEGIGPGNVRRQLQQHVGATRVVSRMGGAAGARVASAGGWLPETAEGLGPQLDGGGGVPCRSLVLQARWQGQHVAVKMILGVRVVSSNSALTAALTAATAVHSGLVRVYSIRLLPTTTSAAITSIALINAAAAAAGDPVAVTAAVGGLRLQAGEGVLVVVMEFCRMGSLEPLTRSIYSPFRPSRSWPAYMARRSLLRTALEVAGALAHMHHYGLAHGGVKPANVMLVPALTDRRKFCAKVTDACLSCAVLQHSLFAEPHVLYSSIRANFNRSGIGGSSISNTATSTSLPSHLLMAPSPATSVTPLMTQLQPQPPSAQAEPSISQALLSLLLTAPQRPGDLFVAPEAVREPGRFLVSQPADVFAFGMLLWSLASAQTSWSPELLMMEEPSPVVGAGQHRPIPAWPSGAHPQMRELYEACVCVIPEQRLCMDSVVSELRRLEESLQNERPKNRAAAAASYAALSAAVVHRTAAGSFLPGFML